MEANWSITNACQDCTCGLAERIAAEDASKRADADAKLQALQKPKAVTLGLDDLTEVDFTVEGKTGSCGNCALGDAYASTPSTLTEFGSLTSTQIPLRRLPLYWNALLEAGRAGQTGQSRDPAIKHLHYSRMMNKDFKAFRGSLIGYTRYHHPVVRARHGGTLGG